MFGHFFVFLVEMVYRFMLDQFRQPFLKMDVISLKESTSCDSQDTSEKREMFHTLDSFMIA